MREMPNTKEAFGDRPAYIRMGYACKAAFPDPDEAYEVWTAWADRYELGSQPDKWEKDWRGMKPPFEVGAGTILSKAVELGIISDAERHFEDLDRSEHAAPPPGPFDEAEARKRKEDEEKGTADNVYPMLTLDEITSRPPPVYLVARHIPEVGVGFLYSVPGAGKSFLALDMALHLSAGLKEWHGDALGVDDEAVVLYIAAEGSYGFRNRVKAWAKAHGLASLPKRFLMIERTIDFMKVEDIDKLLRTVRSIAGLRPCLIVVDTVSRAMPGADENLQKEMTLFVRACDRLRDAFRCAVMGVHHAGKNGDMRGSTVLVGAGDFVFRLEREKGRTIGRLHCEKQKDAADGWDEPYSFDAVALDDGESSLVVHRAAFSVGPSMELTPSVTAAVMGAMREAWTAGQPWAKTYHAKERYAVKRMVTEFGFEAAAAEELLSVWEGTGLIRDAVVSSKSKLRGYQVTATTDNLSEFADDAGLSASVFD
jgi:hypothetical protein